MHGEQDTDTNTNDQEHRTTDRHVKRDSSADRIPQDTHPHSLPVSHHRRRDRTWPRPSKRQLVGPRRRVARFTYSCCRRHRHCHRHGHHRRRRRRRRRQWTVENYLYTETLYAAVLWALWDDNINRVEHRARRIPVANNGLRAEKFTPARLARRFVGARKNHAPNAMLRPPIHSSKILPVKKTRNSPEAREYRATTSPPTAIVLKQI